MTGLAIFGFLFPPLSALIALRLAMQWVYGVNLPWKRSILVAGALAAIEWFIMAALVLMDGPAPLWWIGAGFGFYLVSIVLFYSLKTSILGAAAVTLLIAVGQVAIGLLVGVVVSSIR